MTQEALKLALEAMESVTVECNNFHHPKKDQNHHWAKCPPVTRWDKAITAIKEALAQTEQALTEKYIAALVTGMEVSIDVSTGDHDSGNRLFGVVDLVQQSQGSKHGLILLVQETKANFKEALAQPEQEPVAWKHPDKNMVFWEDTKEVDEYHGFKPTIPLYPYQQRTWVGLTDDEIDEWTPEIHMVIKAIEAKLKEKNT